MTDLEPILRETVPFMLVVFRVAGLFLVAPILGSVMIPRRALALLAVMFGASIYPMARSIIDVPDVRGVFDLVPIMVNEMLVGVAIGLLAAMPFAAVQLAGHTMGHQMGLALAQVFNPESDADAGVLGQLMFFLALGTFIGIGGLETLFVAILHTFETVPIGGLDHEQLPLKTLIGVLTASFELALRLASPVLTSVFVVMVAMGVIMKTMPQINVLTIGFAVKIVAGLIMLAVCIFALEQVFLVDLEETLDIILRWAADPAS